MKSLIEHSTIELKMRYSKGIKYLQKATGLLESIEDELRSRGTTQEDLENLVAGEDTELGVQTFEGGVE